MLYGMNSNTFISLYDPAHEHDACGVGILRTNTMPVAWA